MSRAQPNSDNSYATVMDHLANSNAGLEVLLQQAPQLQDIPVEAWSVQAGEPPNLSLAAQMSFSAAGRQFLASLDDNGAQSQPGPSNI